MRDQIPLSPPFISPTFQLKILISKAPDVHPRLPKWDKGKKARTRSTFYKKINKKPLKFHALRGGFATELMRQGVASASVHKIRG